MKNNKCQVCKEYFNDSQTYEYRGFLFCEEHFDEGIKKVNYKRVEVVETTEKVLKSQAGGEWQNGGYKTMKTDIARNPIPSKVKEPLILQDNEKGEL